MSEAIAEALRGVALFADLGDETVARLAEISDLVDHPKGTTLFRRGDAPEWLYILLAGQVALMTGERASGTTVVEVIDPVDCFVLATVVTDTRYLMTGQTMSPSSILRIQARGLLDLAAADAQFSLLLLTGLGRQFRSLVRQIGDLKLRSTAQRLGCYLLDLDHDQGAGGRVQLPYDKQTLAARLGTSPEHLSRAFATLRSCGVVANRADIELSDPGALASFARPDTIRDPRPLDSPVAPEVTGSSP